MIRFSRYRTLVLAGSLALALPACESTPHAKTFQAEQHTKWDLTRIGVLYQLAQQQYEVGDYDKCRDTLKQAISANTPSAPIQILAAKVDLEKGSIEDATAHLKFALQTDASIPEAYYLLGVAYQRWQNTQTAHDYYQLAWQKKPTEALYLLAVVEMKISLGKYDEAQALLEEKLIYFEQSAAIRAALAKISILKSDYEKATKYYRDATLLSPDDIGLRQNYAESLYFMQRYADVIPILEDLRKNDTIADKHSLLTLLGESYLNSHRARDARTVFAEQTRQNPNDNAAWLNLGMATLALEDYSQAAGVARRVLKAEPQNTQALLLLGLSQEKLGQWEQAHTTLAQAHERTPKDSTVLCLLGLGAEHQGQSDQAQQYYAQAVAINPDDVWAQELLAGTKPAAAPVPLIAPNPAPTVIQSPSAIENAAPAEKAAPVESAAPAPTPAAIVAPKTELSATPAATPSAASDLDTSAATDQPEQTQAAAPAAIEEVQEATTEEAQSE